MGKKYTYEKVKNIINNFGYELISKEYIDNKQRLILKDKENYYYFSSLQNICFRKLRKFDRKNPYTIQNIHNWLILNNKQYELISNVYDGNKKKLVFKDKENYYYTSNLDNILSNYPPNRFGKSNSYTIYNIKLWCRLNNKLFELVDNQIYKKNNIKLKWQCLKNDCKEIFDMSWNDILSQRGCPFCAGYQVGLSNCLATKNLQLTKEWHPTKNNLTPYDVTCGCSKYIWWICQTCGNEWNALISSRNNGRGCPECNKSQGEKRCKEVFISKDFIEILQDEYDKLLKLDKYNNTYFIPQKTFDDLRGIGDGLLSYDFYIPKYDILIEYQGEYHDGTANNQTEEDFLKQQEHDKRKKEYAEQNKYNFLEIWYWEFDNIEEIINKKLLELKECA